MVCLVQQRKHSTVETNPKLGHRPNKPQQAEGGLHASGQTKTEPDNELATATKVEHAPTSKKERTPNLSARENETAVVRATDSEEETQHLPSRRHRSCPPRQRPRENGGDARPSTRRRLKKPAAHFRDQPSLVLLRDRSRVGSVCEQKPRAVAHLNTTHLSALFREEEPSAFLGAKSGAAPQRKTQQEESPATVVAARCGSRWTTQP
jgi:hypothetical protein